MSRMTLVRHGQASFLTEDYDKLSPLGQQQAADLARYWLAQEIGFDEVYCGPRRRHRETAERLGMCFRAAGVSWPAMVSLSAFDEHQVDQLVVRQAAARSVAAGELEALFVGFARASTAAEKHRQFQRLFQALAERWQRGEVTGIESWPDFQRRVNDGLQQLLAVGAAGRRVLVVTSVGPIAVAAQRALRCADDVALEIGWRLWNGSLTEFVFSGDRFTLDVFNALPHLERASWTYR